MEPGVGEGGVLVRAMSLSELGSGSGSVIVVDGVNASDSLEDVESLDVSECTSLELEAAASGGVTSSGGFSISIGSGFGSECLLS